MLESDLFDQLVKVYQTSRQICLFTGAGVSWTQDANYRAPGWKDLLCEIFIELQESIKEDEARIAFQQLASKYPDLWDLASAIRGFAQSDEHFIEILRRAIIKRNQTKDLDKRLKWKNLKGATTLNAVISFCSRVKEINIHPCFEINPKIRAIITANYDWTLEAGGTTKHQAKHFKPMTRPTSTLKSGLLPVYHIHGYLPMSEDEKPEVPLILVRQSYERAYQERGWPVQVIETLLGHFPTLFLGFSFEDEFLLHELQALARKSEPPSHFAFLREADERPPDLLNKIESAGVKVIMYKKHTEIPGLLYRVYFGGLSQTTDISIPRRKESQETYDTATVWDMLMKDKKWSAPGMP